MVVTINFLHGKQCSFIVFFFDSSLVICLCLLNPPPQKGKVITRGGTELGSEIYITGKNEEPNVFFFFNVGEQVARGRGDCWQVDRNCKTDCLGGRPYCILGNYFSNRVPRLFEIELDTCYFKRFGWVCANIIEFFDTWFVTSLAFVVSYFLNCRCLFYFIFTILIAQFLIIQPTRCSCFSIIYSCKTLYMFRTVFRSIFRSSKLHIRQQAYVQFWATDDGAALLLFTPIFIYILFISTCSIV